MGKQRVEFYDYIKGFLMIGIVFGHFLNAFSSISNQGSILHLLVRTYDLPMYMLLGGVLLSKTIGKYILSKLLIRKISTVARPTIILGTIFGVITYIVIGKLSVLNVIKYISGIWFMWSFFLCTIIVAVVTKLIANNRLQIVLLVCIQIILHLLPYNPYNLNYMFPFFVLGFYLPAIMQRISQITNVHYLNHFAFIAFIILFSFWDSSYMIWSSNGLFFHDTVRTIAIAIYRFCIGLCGSICVFNFVKVLYSSNHKIFNDSICAYGRESMSIYIIHSFLVSQCFKSVLIIVCGRVSHIHDLIINHYRFVILFVAPLLSILTCQIIYLLVKYIKRINIISKAVYGR